MNIRVPLFVTGNDLSTIYAPLLRDGRMDKCAPPPLPPPAVAHILSTASCRSSIQLAPSFRVPLCESPCVHTQRRVPGCISSYAVRPDPPRGWQHRMAAAVTARDGPRCGGCAAATAAATAAARPHRICDRGGRSAAQPPVCRVASLVATGLSRARQTTSSLDGAGCSGCFSTAAARKSSPTDASVCVEGPRQAPLQCGPRRTRGCPESMAAAVHTECRSSVVYTSMQCSGRIVVASDAATRPRHLQRTGPQARRGRSAAAGACARYAVLRAVLCAGVVCLQHVAPGCGGHSSEVLGRPRACEARFSIMTHRPIVPPPAELGMCSVSASEAGCGALLCAVSEPVNCWRELLA